MASEQDIPRREGLAAAIGILNSVSNRLVQESLTMDLGMKVDETARELTFVLAELSRRMEPN